MASADTINQTHPGNPVNEQHAHSPNNESYFDLSYVLAQTLRFGELTPHFVADAVPKDRKMTLHSKHNLRTLSMKSPLMQDLQIRKDYFAVPLQAILPLQYERIITNPNLGDDIPQDANTTVVGFWNKLHRYFGACMDAIRDEYHRSIINYRKLFSMCFTLVIQMEYFYSSGSLLNTLGCSGVNRFAWNNGNYIPFSKFAEDFFAIFHSAGCSLLVNDDVRWNASFSTEERSFYPSENVSFHGLLQHVRDNGAIQFTSVDTSSNSISALEHWLREYIDSDEMQYEFTECNPDRCDLERLFAYQIVCAHFYSNDKVDYIYSAELYRQNLFSAFSSFNDNPISDYQFIWNGLSLSYDYCSAFYFNTAIERAIGGAMMNSFGSYLSLIFAFRSSLRFVDYFTGARTRPLAVGNTDVSVNQGAVSVIDVTRNIQRQRFFNAIQRTGRKISQYMQGIFHVNPGYDYHDPMFLAHTSDVLFNEETSNTGADQLTQKQTITSVVRGNADKYAFEFTADRFTVVIGITYFDIPRLYAHSTDRQFFHLDRFDKFNPFMEFIGDQPIYADEISDFRWADAPEVFGYQGRYQEYKQRVSRAVGGFVDDLPGFTFVADNALGVSNPGNISPSYIRSKNSELDEFFVSLTGNTLSKYWHFILVNNNQCGAARPMSFSPNIL